MEKEIRSGIDVGKFIASLIVVLLHAVETSAWYPAGVKFVLTRFAVPFFFICSGYFYQIGLTKAQEPKRYFIDYEKHILKVLFVWEMVIYLPFTIKTYLIKYKGVAFLEMIALLARRLFIIGAGPYWFLVAQFWAAAFLYLCYGNRQFGKMILVTGMIIGLLLEMEYTCLNGILSTVPLFDMINRIVYVIWSWEFNFIMYGIPFMGIGWIVSENKVKWTIKSSLAVFLFCTVLRLVEYNLSVLMPSGFWTQNQITVAFIPQSITFFMFMNAWNPHIARERSLMYRRLSATMYYTHPIFLYEVINPLMNRLRRCALVRSSPIICCITIFSRAKGSSSSRA